MNLTVDVLGAAELLKVHPKTVLDLINSGDIRAAKIGRAWVMLTKDVLDYIERKIVNETARRMRQPLRSPKARSQVAAT
ncbi:excisionase family DNA binding protein [Variovorax boronicumulans]|uniref:helix-turn-helix domain-containing protein n=1 Tax=Variovorax TaxID=34072 RepID=UPI0024731C38|nr:MULTISPECIES: helix-turn-helix domain-containing protein [Variovorax]MDH6168090.1 excisionase family DNA binding protein [Variovorax boronicumulans]MDQ0609564.1 excisionase family DNA binding protein [Variovorax sp. W1I1]